MKRISVSLSNLIRITFPENGDTMSVSNVSNPFRDDTLIRIAIPTIRKVIRYGVRVCVQ